jgi:hypothetical protein
MRHHHQIAAVRYATNAGADLTTAHQRLCETASGLEEPLPKMMCVQLERLASSIQNNTYERDKFWHFGIPNLLREADGYITWRGIRIEHYTHREPGKEWEDSERLAAHCRMLEEKGFPVTWRSAGCRLLYGEAPADTPWIMAMDRIYSFLKSPSGQTGAVMAMDGNAAAAIGKEGGQIIQRWAGVDARAFGTTNLYHQLQREKYESAGVTTLHYEEFVRLMTAVGIRPEMMDAILTMPTPPDLFYCEEGESPSIS